MQRCILSVFVASAIAGASIAAGPFDDLLKRVPDGANAILVIDVGRMYTSPIAVKHNWEKIHERDYVTAAAGVPPHTRRIVIGGLLEPSTLEPTWRAGVAEFREPVMLSKLSQAVPGSEDEIEGVSAVLSSGHGYLTSFGPKLIGSMNPANRQSLGRWIRGSKRHDGPSLSPYLSKAVDGISDKFDAVLSFDLADMLDSKGLQFRLAASRTLADKKSDVDALVKELSGLVGVTLTIKFDQDINGELRVDLREAPETFANYATPLLMELFDSLGAPIIDLEKWRHRVKGTSVVIEGKLSDRDLRKLGGLLMPSTPTIRSENVAAGGSGNPIELSRRYFRSVNSLIEDLRAEKASSFSRLSMLFQQYAKKIDDLPILNVDPELVTYGGQVASTFRALSTNARNTSSAQRVISTTAQESTVDVGGAYRYGYGVNRFGAAGGWNYYRPNYQNVNNYQQVTMMQTAASANESSVRANVWKQIDDSTAQIRRKMVEKFMVEF